MMVGAGTPQVIDMPVTCRTTTIEQFASIHDTTRCDMTQRDATHFN
ncbi:hypothetical protein [Burkholderia arboris]|nr:hypothetical protein [Burkholderia arboris]